MRIDVNLSMRYLLVALLFQLTVNCIGQRTGTNRVSLCNDSIRDSEPVVSKSAVNIELSISVDSLQLSVDSSGVARISVPADYVSDISIQQYKWNKWVNATSIQVSRLPIDSVYILKVLLHSGENRLRLRSIPGDSGDVSYYCCEIMVQRKSAVLIDDKVGQYGQADTIHLPELSMWEIYDQSGNLLRKGTSDRIPLNGLEEGGYYLNYDNRTTQFFVYCQGHKH